MAARVASPDFVGRGAELAELVAALERAGAGDPAVVLVGGESGVGKTRLVSELIACAVANETRVLTGDCVALGDAELPYAPIIAALGDVERSEVEAIVGGAASGLAPLLPQVGEAHGAATSGSLAQGRLFELLLALIGGLAGDSGPVLLVVEDLHWADRSTRDFMTFLIRNARRQRIALVATYRTDELNRRHPLRPFLAEAERAPAVTRLALSRFTREELRMQLAGILGRRPEPQLIDELFARAEGNAFYTEELVAASNSDRLPENVRDTLMLRIDALTMDAQAVLRVSAAAGARVRHGLLVEASDLTSDTLVAGLREAVVHHVLVHDPASDAYAFRHALLREALLDDLLPGERGPLHGALAQALTEKPALSVSASGAAAELAFHWAAAHNLPAAFAASCEAGAEAERLAAFAEANTHFERAAELWDAVPDERRADGPSRIELLRRAAETAYLAGDYDRAIALVRRALTLADDPMTIAVLRERLGRFLWVNGLSDDALDACRSAVASLPPAGSGAQRARVLGAEGHLLMLFGLASEAEARCEEALAVARAAGARTEEGRILTSLGSALVLRGDRDNAIACLREGQRIAEEVRDLEEMTRSYVNLGQALDSSGRLEEAVEVAREGAAMAAREGIGTVRGLLVAELAGRLLRLGRWEEAGRVTDAVLDTPLTGIHRGAALTLRGHLDALRGDAERARQRLNEAERLQHQAVGASWTAPVAIARTEAALWAGDPEDARGVVTTELGSYKTVDQEPSIVAPVLAVGIRAEADLAARARDSGDADAEHAAAQRTIPLLQALRHLLASQSQAGSPPPEAMLYGAWGEAEAARAAAHSTAADWRALAARWETCGCPYPAAYAHLREAETELETGGSRAAVQSALASAHAAAIELGACPLRAEIESLARRGRIGLDTPPADRADGADGATETAAQLGLTPREHEVLRRLAAGESNREIGQSLYISHKTVSVHVSRILTKLEARTRTEAASLAQRLGLLDEPA